MAPKLINYYRYDEETELAGLQIARLQIYWGRSSWDAWFHIERAPNFLGFTLINAALLFVW